MALITFPALPIEFCTQLRQVHTLLIITVITFSEGRRVSGNNYEELLIYLSPKFLIAILFQIWIVEGHCYLLDGHCYLLQRFFCRDLPAYLRAEHAHELLMLLHGLFGIGYSCTDVFLRPAKPMPISPKTLLLC